MKVIDIQQPEVERDRWGRPKINGKTYLRPSTVAKAIESAGGLPKWMGARVFEGLQKQPELLDAHGDVRDLVEQAADAGGANDGSGFGTAVHEIVESLVRTGMVPVDAKDEHIACALSVLDALDDAGFDILLSEVFVISEEFGCAGTTDMILRHRGSGRTYIGDIKTSGSAAATAAKFGSLAWSVQLCIYSNGRVLTEEGEIDFSDIVGADVERDRAVIIHVERETAKATLVDLDLEVGRDAAELAQRVIAMRRQVPGRVIH